MLSSSPAFHFRTNFSKYSWDLSLDRSSNIFPLPHTPFPSNRQKRPRPPPTHSLFTLQPHTKLRRFQEVIVFADRNGGRSAERLGIARFLLVLFAALRFLVSTLFVFLFTAGFPVTVAIGRRGRASTARRHDLETQKVPREYGRL
jgi:hypothetical protein